MDVQAVDPVKLIIGILFPLNLKLEPYIRHMRTVFGPVDAVSDVYLFDYTDYYKDEIGDSVNRQFISFQRLMDPSGISDVKLLTNHLESNYFPDGCRQINLDPGYLDLHKLVLASAKYGRQKIFLEKGIYADPTLFFSRKEFHSYEWSFPDFRSGAYDKFFSHVRNIYKKQLHDHHS